MVYGRYSDPVVARLSELTPAQRRAWDYILEYARETGRRCFSYNDLARYWSRARTPINIQTLDRRIRELVDLGVLERREARDRRGRTRVFFCMHMSLYTRFVSAYILGGGGGGPF